MATHDFKDGAGPVPAHQHPNGGGWVAETASVDAAAYVGPFASVYNHARVLNDKPSPGATRIADAAQVCGCAWVHTASEVAGSARVHGCCNVTYSSIGGDAEVCGDAQLTRANVSSGFFNGGHHGT